MIFFLNFDSKYFPCDAKDSNFSTVNLSNVIFTKRRNRFSVHLAYGFIFRIVVDVMFTQFNGISIFK